MEFMQALCDFSSTASLARPSMPSEINFPRTFPSITHRRFLICPQAAASQPGGRRFFSYGKLFNPRRVRFS
jgi:hypothetical protein